MSTRLRVDTRAPIRLCIAVLVAMLVSPSPGAAQTIDTLALESHARFLAHDLLEGRSPASKGEAIAALYLTTRLQGLGLRPLPDRDYRMRVPLTAVLTSDDETVARLIGDDGTRTLRAPAFYHPGGARGAFRDFGGELLFAGSAPTALAALEGQDDLSGKVVVLTPPWSGVHEALREIRRRGAAGSVSLVPNEFFFGRLRIVRGPTRYFLPDAIDDPANQGWLSGIVGGPELIEALGLEAEARPGNTLERARPLDLRIEVEIPHETEGRTGYNVAGYIPGSDPELRDEWVVYVAHYDHVGYGEPTDGDSIWNGFIDNAAGTSMLLEIARSMAPNPPARSVAFLFVTAEEQGLLGSNWFVHDAPIPPDRIRAVINLDGGAPPAPPTSWGLVGADGSAAGAIARRVVEDRGWSVRHVDVGPQSDHWPFHRAGIPALLLFPGSTLEGLSEEEAEELTERWLHPHTPDDEWSPDFPFSGLKRYAELALEIGSALAAPDPDLAGDYERSTRGTRRLESASGISLDVLVEAENLGGQEVEIGEITFPSGAGANAAGHTHGRPEIFYVLSGRLDHVVNGESNVLEPGMVGIVRPGDTVIHRVLGDAPVRAIVVWAPAGELERLAPFFEERPLNEPGSR